jgi:hypothetical protein
MIAKSMLLMDLDEETADKIIRYLDRRKNINGMLTIPNDARPIYTIWILDDRH